MNSNLKNKNVIITGGTGGIGSACAEEFLKENAKVILIDIDEQKLQEKVEELSQFGSVVGYKINLSDPKKIQEGIDQIYQKQGTFDCLIQTAGILESVPGLEISEKQWDFLLNVNAKGLFFMMQEVVKHSMKENGGTIVNFCSMSGIRGMRPEMAGAHYSASKGAVKALTMQAATEWGQYGIRVNAVAPGGVMTQRMKSMEFPKDAFDMIPLKRLSEPKEIANAVVFLASDLSSMITGQTLVIDGGSSVVGI